MLLVRKKASRAIEVLALSAIIILLIVYVFCFGFHFPIYRDGGLWVRLKMDDTHLSPSMILALRNSPVAVPGQFSWRESSPGFQVGELPALVHGNVVDRILLARIDPTRFRFGVYNHSRGYRTLDQWMRKLGAALVVNGSYFSPGWKPATPLLSNGRLLGPTEYDRKGGVFSAAKGVAKVQDLINQGWRTAFEGMTAGLVSFPILINGSYYDQNKTRWLANRSFIGQDKSGWIIIGTTVDAFFSLDRLAMFLHESPLELTMALNLDGGPVACQAIQLDGFERKTYGKWEMRIDDDDALLLMSLRGIPPAMPVVIAVFPK
jgi:Phosphodiester glycosidase